MSKHKRKYVIPPEARLAGTHYYRIRILNPKHQSPLDYLRAHAEDVGVALQCNTCRYYRHNDSSCEVTEDYQYDLGLCLDWDSGISSAEQVTLDL